MRARLSSHHARRHACRQPACLRLRDANCLVNCLAVYRGSVPCYDALLVIDPDQLLHRMSVECMAAFGIVTVDNDPFGGARS
jgi:hypothetical protein